MPRLTRNATKPSGNTLVSRRTAARQAREEETVKPRSSRRAATVVEPEEDDLPFGEEDLSGQVTEEEEEDLPFGEDEDEDEDEDEELDDEEEQDEDDDEADEEEEMEDEEPAPAPRRGRQTVTATASKAKSTPLPQAQAQTPAVRRPTRNGPTALAIPLQPRNRMLQPEDLLMPQLKAAQGLSKVVINRQVELGNWYITGQNQPLGDTVYVIPVDMSMSRSVFVNGKGVVCRSFDLVQGMGNPGGLCEGTQEEIDDPTIHADDRGCELRIWVTDEKTGERVPPACQKAYTYPILLLVPPEDAGDEFELEDAKVTRAMLTMRSTWSQAARAINTNVMSDADPVWHMNVFQLTLTVRSGQKGTSYIPQVDWIDNTPDKLVPMAEKYARMISNQFIRANLEGISDDDE